MTDDQATPRTEANVTGLLGRAAAGDAAAAADLLPLVYDQLRAIAQQRMRHERPGHTLQATELVHDAFLRLVDEGRTDWAGRAQFFASAAEAMRRILIEHARARARKKRGGDGKQRASRHALDISCVADLATDREPEEILALDDAICRVGEREPRLGEIVRLRFYAGLSVEETARVMGVSPRTVKRDWAFIRAWLYRQLAEGSG